jgi:hypothetical protein
MQVVLSQKLVVELLVALLGLGMLRGAGLPAFMQLDSDHVQMVSDGGRREIARSVGLIAGPFWMMLFSYL